MRGATPKSKTFNVKVLSHAYSLISNDFSCNRGYRAEGAEHGAWSRPSGSENLRVGEELGARRRRGAVARSDSVNTRPYAVCRMPLIRVMTKKCERGAWSRELGAGQLRGSRRFESRSGGDAASTFLALLRSTLSELATRLFSSSGEPATRLSLSSSLFGRRGDLSSAPPAVALCSGSRHSPPRRLAPPRTAVTEMLPTTACAPMSCGRKGWTWHAANAADRAPSSCDIARDARLWTRSRARDGCSTSRSAWPAPQQLFLP